MQGHKLRCILKHEQLGVFSQMLKCCMLTEVECVVLITFVDVREQYASFVVMCNTSIFVYYRSVLVVNARHCVS